MLLMRCVALHTRTLRRVQELANIYNPYTHTLLKFSKRTVKWKFSQVVELQGMKSTAAYALILSSQLHLVDARGTRPLSWIHTPIGSNGKNFITRFAERHGERHQRDAVDPVSRPRRSLSSYLCRPRWSVPALSAASPAKANNEKSRSLFIFGVGYVATAVALTFLSKGWTVHGTCTDPRKVKSLGDQGIKAYIFDDWSGPMMQPEPLEALTSASCILSTVPPTLQSGTDPVLVAHEADLKWAHQNGSLRWIGYMSSTGVYGDRGGGWVTEQDEPWPSVPRTKARLKAEKAWLHLQENEGLPVHVFRLAGIYGPGRSALDSVARHNGDIRLAGADDGTMISRIHVADIVGVVEASVETPDPGMVVNVADDLPSTRYETLAFGCKLMGFPRQDPDPTENYINRRGGGNKRVDNSKMCELLEASGRTLIFPDFRVGLRALHKGDGRPFDRPVDSGRSIKDTISQNLESKLREVSLQVSRLEEKIDEVLTLVRHGDVIIGTGQNGQIRENTFGNGGNVSDVSLANELETGFDGDEEVGGKNQHLGTVMGKSCLSEAGDDKASVIDK